MSKILKFNRKISKQMKPKRVLERAATGVPKNISTSISRKSFLDVSSIGKLDLWVQMLTLLRIHHTETFAQGKLVTWKYYKFSIILKKQLMKIWLSFSFVSTIQPLSINKETTKERNMAVLSFIITMNKRLLQKKL